MAQASLELVGLTYTFCFEVLNVSLVNDSCLKGKVSYFIVPILFQLLVLKQDQVEFYVVSVLFSINDFSGLWNPIFQKDRYLFSDIRPH